MEKWKDIINYQGVYQISNLGRVRSLSRTYKWGVATCKIKEKILKPIIEKYARVGLCQNGKCKLFSIHRLVAEAFIENPNNYKCVMHEDDNTLNNNVNNLKWGTHAMNSHDMKLKGTARNQYTSII